MNTHKNARLTYVRRIEMVHDITQRGMSVPLAALTHGVSAPTARKWLGRFLVGGDAGLKEASSRPAVSPWTIDPSKALAIVELRHRHLTQARIAQALCLSKSTVGRVLARAGLSMLSIFCLPNLSFATSTKRPATCSTSTPRSSGASSGSAIA